MAENPDLGVIRQTLEGFASSAAQPEQVEQGPGSVAPTTEDAKNSPFMPVRMTEEETSLWWQRVERARTRRDARTDRWDLLLKAYLPIVSESGKSETIKYNGHFRNVHSKLPSLFFKTPDLVLTPKEPGPSNNAQPNPATGQASTMEDIISIKQAVLQDMLGREGIKASRLMDELLFDVLAWSGIAACKVGYRCVQKQIPNAAQPPQGILNLQQAAPTSVTIFEEWYARRFSPKKLLLPDDLYSTRYDEDATWKGMEFFMAPERVKRLFGKTPQNPLGLTDEEINKAAEDELRAKYEEDKQGANMSGLVRGVEIFCKSEYYTSPGQPNYQPHPQAFHQLILMEGVKNRPVVWRPCTDQEFDMQGKLTPGSIDRNPIQVLSIRDLADSPYPESDAAFANQNIKTIGTWRRQSVAMRDRAIGKYLYDLDAFDDADIDKLKNAEVGDYVGVESGKLDKGADKILVQTAKVTNSPDDYRNAQLLKNDMDEVIGIGSPQAGNVNDTIHTATEVATATGFSQSRNEKERSRVEDFYLDIVRLIDQLVMRYATTDRYVAIAGDAAMPTLQMWNSKMVSGRYIYDISPDSSHTIDAAQDFTLTLQLYNLAARDPLLNRAYILKRLVRMRGMDPSKAIAPPPVPQRPQPEPLKPTFAFKPEDIVMLNASGDPIQLELAKLLITLLGQAVQKPPQPGQAPAQPPHGGPGEAVNQHHAGTSGGRENAPGAMNIRNLRSGVH